MSTWYQMSNYGGVLRELEVVKETPKTLTYTVKSRNSPLRKVRVFKEQGYDNNFFPTMKEALEDYKKKLESVLSLAHQKVSSAGYRLSALLNEHPELKDATTYN